MKITKKLSERLESFLGALGYSVRYEKGSFKGGYCVVEEQKIVMVNKFFPLEGRISTLMDVALSLSIDELLLNEEDKKLYKQMKEHPLRASNPTNA